jgi:thioesterase domain-containing protein
MLAAGAQRDHVPSNQRVFSIAAPATHFRYFVANTDQAYIMMTTTMTHIQALMDAMPPVNAMAVKVASLSADRVCLQAPLAANVNDKGCAFGGSIAGVMTLAGWALLRARTLDLPVEVYVADSQIRYLAPLYQGIEAQAWLLDASLWQPALQRLRERGKASLEVQAQVLGPTHGQPVATMNARFAFVMTTGAGDKPAVG